MKFKRHSGFTLIEMMIALVILAVLITVVAPSFSNIIKDNRILSDVYAIRAGLNSARSEALTQRTIVTFCPSDDGATCEDPADADWKHGYIAFTDFDGDGDPADPNDLVFLAKVIDADTLDAIKYEDPDGNEQFIVQFNSSGFAMGLGGVSTSGTFTLCDDRGATEARGVILSLGGIVRAAQDPNDTGTALDLGGAALVCP